VSHRRQWRAEPAPLLQEAGLCGPSFLATKNYFVIKEYNFSDLYVLFVGHLSDRIADPRPFETPWGKVAQLPTGDLDRMQDILTARLLPRQDRRRGWDENALGPGRLSKAKRS
jgi:hypothetical protein